MGNFVDKIRNLMLGADDEEEIYDEYVEETEAAPVRESFKERERERERERGVTDLNYVRSHRTGGSPKVVDYQANIKMQVVLTNPTDVNDAFSICDFIKDNKICVVNLEGVERENAQRIADFLGGVSYSLTGEIKRVSNEIFIMVPANVQITGELTDELKSGGFFPMVSHSFR